MAKFKPKDGSIKFKDATQNMNTKEKLDYIWEYYKGLILASITVVAVIFYTLNTHHPSTHLHIAVTSGFAHTSNQFQFDDLDNDNDNNDNLEAGDILANHIGLTVETEELSHTLNQLLLNDEQLDNYNVIIQHIPINYETIPVFATLVGAGELDIIITFQHDFDELVPLGHFRSIRDLNVDLPDDIFINDYGISLKYLPILNDYIHPSHTDMELVLGVVAGTGRTEEVENLLNELVE